MFIEYDTYQVKMKIFINIISANIPRQNQPSWHPVAKLFFLEINIDTLVVEDG